jgi:hypothetical protein
VDLTQRGLVNRRLRFADGDLVTKYVFPFWDPSWKIALYVVDRLGRGPVIVDPPIREDKDRHLSSVLGMTGLRGLESIEPPRFAELYHYDPWWVFRGMGGVPGAWRRAILPTNIARTFPFGKNVWKVYDVEVESDGERIRTIVAKDEIFRRHMFTKESIDLRLLRPPP